MLEWTSCKSRLQGNIISWDRVELINHNMTESEEDFDVLCQPLVPGYTSFPMKTDFYKAVEMCHQFGGLLAVPKSQDELDQMMTK